MRKREMFFIILFCFAFSLVLQETAFSETGGKPIPKNNVQLGVGYDYFHSDLQFLKRSNDPTAAPDFNNYYNDEFTYEPKYIYLKYGVFDWLEVSGRLGLVRMELSFNEIGGTDDGTFETQSGYEIGYYGAKVKGKIFELKNGLFASAAAEGEYARSGDIESASKTTGTVDKNEIEKMQFYSWSASVISGWDINHIIIPYAGVGYKDLRVQYKYLSSSFPSSPTDKEENANKWYGIVGGNIILFKHLVFNAEGAFGDRIMSVTGQLGFQFNLFGDKNK
jgi:opacity protein-like surface antigen